MKRFFFTTFAVALMVTAAGAQDITPTPFFCSYADTLVASTYNGELLRVGTVIEAYDPQGVLCGRDTVRLDGGSGDAIFGYFSVYGDDPNTAGGIDEGAIAGDQISFKINGRDATVAQGDDIWNDQTLKSVTLEATASVVLTAITLPADRQALFNETAQFEVRVRNDGDGLDFYDVTLSMSQTSGASQFDWEALEPDSFVYADAGAEASVFFSVRTPVFASSPDDTLDVIEYTVVSQADTSVKIVDTVSLYMTVTDVEDDDLLVPGSFVLEQNYPNPFNPGTTISFELSVTSRLKLEVFDVLGRRVFTDDLGSVGSGPGEYYFDGSRLASGIYFYRLSTDSESKSRKMILLK